MARRLPRAEVRDHDVGANCQFDYGGAHLGVGKVDRERAFAAILIKELAPFAGHDRAVAARFIALERFDLDDVGAAVGE